MKTLKLAEDLRLPLDTVTQTIAILAKRRAGKSYTMRRLVEQLFKAAQQVVVVDPKGDQWGLRSSADGKGPGLPIVILGGERGDVPLEASGGEVVAKLVVEERVSVLIDLSLFRKHEVATFMTAFLENLYRLKAREQYRTPLMLVIDEADAVAPQKPQKGEERMLGAAEDIVRRGGQRGIGCVFVTQRSAVLNKNVLTQAQILVALRTIAPQDLAAMDAWIQVHGEPDQRKTLMESLPSLPIGDAWFWSPGWPTVAGIFQRVHVLPIETFDSGKSPEPGAKPVVPKQAADVDLEALKRQMAATLERAKADDPRELKKQIRELTETKLKLQGQIASKPSVSGLIAAKPEAPALTAAERETIEKLYAQMADVRASFAKTMENFTARMVEKVKAELDTATARTALQATRTAEAIADILQRAGLQNVLVKLERVTVAPAVNPGRPVAVSIHPQTGVKPATRQALQQVAKTVAAAAPQAGEDGLSEGERRTLIALAMYPDVSMTRETLGMLTGYGTTQRNVYVGSLTGKGYVVLPAVGQVRVTDQGIAALGTDYEPLPTGHALLQWWRPRLDEGPRTILDVIVAAGAAGLSREAVSQATGLGTTQRNVYIGQLGARRLVLSDGRGNVRPSPDLFD